MCKMSLEHAPEAKPLVCIALTVCKGCCFHDNSSGVILHTAPNEGLATLAGAEVSKYFCYQDPELATKKRSGDKDSSNLTGN